MADRSQGSFGARLASALVLAPLALAAAHVGGLAFEVVLAASAVILVFELSRTIGHHLVWLVAGGLYIAAAIAALWWLRGNDVAGRSQLYWLFAIVWGSDIGGYLVGRAVGGPKLAPILSPNKTWSGFAGGLVLAVVLASAVVAYFHADGWLAAGAVPPLAAAAAVSVVSQAGDLLESAVKRRFGVKDSGALIPGHGGLFDRVDGLVAAAIALAAAVALINGSGGGNVMPWMD